MIRLGIATILLVGGVYEAKGSTFIGNGGSAGDIELAVTLAEIRQTLSEVEEDFAFCECADSLAGNTTCDLLRGLNEAQVKYCKEILSKVREDIASKASVDSKIKYSWSDDPFKVKTGDASERLVDAIARPEKNEVILHRPRFLEMEPSLRIALLTHELMHFVSSKGSSIEDDKEVGPFSEGRALLDAVGAATAVAAHSTGTIRDFSPLENVSRGYKKFIFQVDIKTIRHGTGHADDLLKGKTSSSTSLIFEYKPKNFGFRLGTESIINESTYKKDIDVKESMVLGALGFGYHWFPKSAKLSRWNESHISLFVDALSGSSSYQVKDDFVKLEDKAPVRGYQGTLQVHLPMIHGFWGVLGWQKRRLTYEYKELRIKTNDLQDILYFGGAYAF